jgi:histidinol phosphatase-like enzyme
MVIMVDIDGTICTQCDNASYQDAEPIQENIDKINKLKDEGHTIIYWTARGSTTGIDWTEVTTEQFKNWGVKYDDLRLTKPFYDLFIDDRCIHINDFMKGK